MRRAFLAMAVAATVAAASSAAGAAEKLSLILGQSAVTSNEAFNVFVPIELGYFKDEGLEVEYQTSQGGTQAIQLLSAGQADIGLSSVPGVILARQKGIEAVAVYNYLRAHSTALAVLEGGPIKQPADLKGKKIGVVSMSSTRTFDGRAMVTAAGLDPDKDVTWVPVGFGAQAAAALTRGDVSALALWDATYVDIENTGVNLNLFTFPFQKDLVGYVFISTDDKIAERKDALAKFLRAIAKGTVFAAANPEGAACLYLKASGDIKQARDKEKALADATNVVINNVANAKRASEDVLWGSWPENAWAVNLKYYQNLGVIQGDAPALDSLYIDDPDFYRTVSDFDAKAVMEQAKSYKCSI